MDRLRLTPAGATRVEPTASPWLRPIVSAPAGNPRAVLVLLPHAGGGAHTYAPWAAVLPAGVTALAVEYPGHGTRAAQPLVGDRPSLVAGLTGALTELHDALGGRPLVLGGHSLGALLAHEVAGELQRRDRPVAGLFLSAVAPPHRRAGLADLSRLDDEALAAHLGATGDIPPVLLADAEARTMFLAMVRHDLALARPDGTGGATPTVVRARAAIVGGADDSRCPADELAHWAALIDGPAEVTVLPGGHFYYRQRLDAVGRLLAGLTDAVAAPPPAPSDTATGEEIR